MIIIGILNIFQKKADVSNNHVVTKILQMIGGTHKHTEVNYNNMSKEGYQNFVVFACLDKIVKAAIAINWNVCAYDRDGKAGEIPNHPMKLLIEKPNQQQGQAKFIERAIKFYYIGGETFFHKIDLNGIARELYCYRPDRCVIKFGRDSEKPIEKFIYRAGFDTPIKPENILHWKTFNPMDDYDGLGRGMSMLGPAARSIDQNNAIKQWNYSLMKNGNRKDGAFIIKEMMDDDAYKRAKEALEADYNGDNPGGLMLLEGGIDFREFSNNPKDTDWLQGAKQTVVEICSALGVDPILIGFNEFSSYNNKAEAKKALYTETVIPLVRELADELGPFLGLDDREFFDFDYSNIPVLQENIKEKFDMVSGVTFMTENDKREYVGLNAKDGLNVYRIPMSYIDIPEGQPIQPPQPTGDVGNDDVNFKALSGGGEHKSVKQTKALQIFNTAIEAGIKKQQPIIGKYFIDQAKRIKKGFKSADPIEIKADDQQELTEDQLKTLLDSLLDWDAENELFTSTIVQLYIESMGAGYNIADEIFALNLKETGIEAIMNEDLLKWARESAAQQVTYVNQTTKDQIKRIISDGMGKGLSNAEIAQNIFDQSEINSIGRAKRIASTEIHNSIIKGNHQAMVDAGVKKKKWVTARDEAVRPWHSNMNGEIRKINERFSNGLMHPGDPDGPAKEIVECRCIEVPADFE